MTVSKALSSSELLSTSQVAKVLDVHRTTVWLWIKNGSLESERRGNFHGVAPAALKRFLKIYRIQNLTSPAAIDRAIQRVKRA